MKKIHLIRHAKSSWADPNLSDEQRPLNSRGINACKVMAPAIVKSGCLFENVFCSPAVRAQQTIENLCHHLPKMNVSWQTESELYTFNGANLLMWLRNQSDDINELVLLGHNPAVTDLCNGLTGTDLENIPTCGYALLTFETEQWQSIKPKTAKLEIYLTPKKASMMSDS